MAPAGVDGIKITTHDGLKLTANVFLPKITSVRQKFPTIVMVNSWSMPNWEYIGQAQRAGQRQLYRFRICLARLVQLGRHDRRGIAGRYPRYFDHG